MTSTTFAPSGTPSRPLTLVSAEKLGVWMQVQTPAARAWAEANGFAAKFGEVLLMPGETGEIMGAVGGLGDDKARARGRFATGAMRPKLPEGAWHFETSLAGDDLDEAALGWLLAGYTFDRYASAPAPKATLVAPEGLDTARIEAIAAGDALARRLIDIPASDMGPDEIEAEARDLARAHGAEISVTSGDDLARDFPMIAAVGRASTRAPRLIDMTWGTTGPTVTIVGKGVAFDTGGLNLKPGASMGLMKKDMGGAANALGLAHMLMATNTPLRLRVLIPAVENSVSGAAFRPQDILTSRKGLTVEINNTDAEGRLILADALALADEAKPDLIISLATLTGAARVALGPDVPPFYATSDAMAAKVETAAHAVRDPLWRMPFWDPYEELIEPGIADLDNSPKGGMAGSITAALFLRRFVTETPYLHFDIYGWTPAAKPGRAKGGAAQAIRALFRALPDLAG